MRRGGATLGIYIRRVRPRRVAFSSPCSLFFLSRGYSSRPPRSTPSKTKAKPRPGAGTTKNAAKPKAKAEGEGDESEASTAEGEAKGAEGSAPEHTPKEKLGIWIMNNFKLAEVRQCFAHSAFRDPVLVHLSSS